MRDELAMRDLCNTIRETAFALHRYLGHGHLEKVYENGLAHRLTKIGIALETQRSIRVFDEDGTVLGHYVADLLVEKQLIIELKSAKALGEEHFAQLMGYLRATRFRDGLLINFGAPKLQIKKIVF